MKLGNRKGEAVTITLVTLAIIVGIMGFLMRPVIDKVLPIFGGQQKTVQTDTVSVKPIYVQLPPDATHPKGQIIAAQQVSEKLSDFKGEEKVTFWGWVKSLGFIWFVLMILSAIGVPGVGMFMSKVNNAAKAALADASNAIQDWQNKHSALQAEAKKIVDSVATALSTFDASIAAANSGAAVATDPQVKATYQAVVLALTNEQSAFLAAMSKKQDSTTKALVATLKNS